MAYTCPLCGDKNAYCGAWEVKCNSKGCRNYDPPHATSTYKETIKALISEATALGRKVGTMNWGSPDFLFIDGVAVNRTIQSGWRWKGYYEYFENQKCTHVELLNAGGSPMKDGIHSLADFKKALAAHGCL